MESDGTGWHRQRIPDATLTDLKARLARARFAEPLPGAGWELGTDVAYLRSLVAYWRLGAERRPARGSTEAVGVA